LKNIRSQSGYDLTQLIHWARSISIDEIPRNVLNKASNILADNLSAMIGAREEPEVQSYCSLVLARTTAKEAMIWNGGSDRSDVLSASVANALAADWLELDEGYRVTLCHAGLYLIPSLLAQAEVLNLSYKEMLRIIAVGYEVVTRVARSWIVEKVTMQSHGRYGAIGAATAIALAKNLAADTFLQSVTGAATLITPAPRNHLGDGILIRNAWPASGACNGLMAVEWAQCGIGGAPESLFDVYSTVLGGHIASQHLTQNLGDTWAILDSYSKIYACCQHLHAAIEVALTLRARNQELADTDSIREIIVHTHEMAAALSNPAPANSLAAKFSLPHAMALAFALGKDGVTTFSNASLQNHAVIKLRNLVKIHPWLSPPAPPNDRPAQVTVIMNSGQQYCDECLSALGGPDRPFPDNMWIEKMKNLAQPAYPEIVEVFQRLSDDTGDARDKKWPVILQQITQS
jgi:2-methylcitrate dehydratase PrpD